jgi:hypothetical protein
MSPLKLGCLVAGLLMIAAGANAQQLGQRPAGLIGASALGQGAAIESGTGAAPQAPLVFNQQIGGPASCGLLCTIFNRIVFNLQTSGQRVSLH